ncbi:MULTISPECIES: PD40 domain-containing protein [Brevibacillus]|jgi:TolB protein|uniref:Uncharacterized protein n=1 Tax=Brevibacillus borstelensis AK1 TaxID=1300222 RepID=M8DK95_9BACL|nr:PD40 domain-containing protein [Brevibacillus borstelensis]EMT54018.1 hypothetical protein I532_00390 [Brevibacillus borstelensis AK1]KKX53858.1 hypothetical protein X546_15935 [Brevibacillus borstelensis cifa_chp40]MBE5396489.1 PD40 domain-containing protein [Brevibacillus borstelensis]MCC0563729.1 PD40 domain-containing protein [Brevibacillus borstelensis]MCM3469572.1 PD40 domain-containing protein [Brevibacillus borstelensis]
MRDQERFPNDGYDEGTIAQLLSHLQELRRAVPVNYMLKEKLKKQLLQRIQELEQERKRAQTSQKSGKARRLLLVTSGGLLLLLLAVCFGMWGDNTPSVRHYSVMTLATDGTEPLVDLNADGTVVAYVEDKRVVKTREPDHSQSQGTLVLSDGGGEYTAVAWSNRGKQLAVVEQAEEFSRLWIVSLADENRPSSKRLLKEEKGVVLGAPSWSQYDESIAYTRQTSDGTEEIWVSSTVAMQDWKLVEGTQPEWSPDGRLLAFVKQDTVHVMEVRSGAVTKLEAGVWPSWNNDDSLTFTTPDGKMKQAQMSQDPPEIRIVPIRRLGDGALVKAQWSSDRNHLLLTQKQKGETKTIISIASR